MYQSQRLEYLHLESIVMSRIEGRAGGRVAFSYAYEDDLRSCGVKPAECDGLIDIVRQVGIVMSRIEGRAGGRVAFSYAYEDDLRSCGVKPAECDGLIDIVRQVGGTELCLFLREDEPGSVRGNLRSKGSIDISGINLRSKGSIDISGIAVELGGGGHAAAAGFTFKGAPSTSPVSPSSSAGEDMPRLRASPSRGRWSRLRKSCCPSSRRFCNRQSRTGVPVPTGRLAIRPAAGGGRPFPHTYERTAWESASPAN